MSLPPRPPGPIPDDYVFGQSPPPAEPPEPRSRLTSPAPGHARQPIQYQAAPRPAGPSAFDSLPHLPTGRPREELLEDLRAQRVRAESHVAAMVRERLDAEQALEEARERQTEAEREMANVERQLRDLGEGRALRRRF